MAFIQRVLALEAGIVPVGAQSSGADRIAGIDLERRCQRGREVAMKCGSCR